MKKLKKGLEIISYKSGGQHGGLDRWFAEKWVDIKTGESCGRQEGEKRDGYPACRPSKRISSDTPKTAKELSSEEKQKFKKEKTSSQRISYQHQRKQDGGLILNNMNLEMMKSGGNVPTNPSLWSRAKSLAKQKYDVYPSAYANGFAAKWYKSNGGNWRKAESKTNVMANGGLIKYQEGKEVINPNNPVNLKEIVINANVLKQNPKPSIEKQINRWLGNPSAQAQRDSESEKWFNPKTKKWESQDPIDNIRHTSAGRYTAEAIANKTGNIPFISNTLGYLGSNLLGAAHEASTYFIDPRWNYKKSGFFNNFKTITREGLEDLYNNNVGAMIGVTPFITPSQKTRIIKNLSNNNLIPDGYGEADPFHKGIKSNYKQGGQKMPPELAYARFAAAGNLNQLGKYGYQDGGEKLPNDFNKFQEFNKTLPDNLRDDNFKYGDYSHYDLYGMWDASGKPKSFDDVKDTEFFPLQEDGFYHGFSVGNDGIWLKPKSHPSAFMEYMVGQLDPNSYDHVIQREDGRLQYVPNNYITKKSLKQKNETDIPQNINPRFMYSAPPSVFSKGGSVTLNAGGENHRIYVKTTNRGEGEKGNIMVNHPTMDKGMWDTIDLTKKAGVKTIAQGVAATKKWHKENPYMKQKGGSINLNLPVFKKQKKEPFVFNKFLVNDKNNNVFVAGFNPTYQNEKLSVGPYMVGVGNKYFQKFPVDYGVRGNYNVNDKFNINMNVGKNNMNVGMRYNFKNGGKVKKAEPVVIEVDPETYTKNQYERSKDFHTKWMTSPMYNKMLNASDPTNAEKINKIRFDNLNNTRFVYEPIQPEDKVNTGGDSDIEGVVNIYPRGYNDNVSLLGTHEMSHSIDRPSVLFSGSEPDRVIPYEDVYRIDDYANVNRYNPKSLEDELYLKEFLDRYDYIATPTETRARLNEIRDSANQNKIYDPFTQKVNKKIFKKLTNFKFEKNPNWNPMDDLKSVYTDKQIINLLNTVSKKNNVPLNPQMMDNNEWEIIS